MIMLKYGPNTSMERPCTRIVTLYDNAEELTLDILEEHWTITNNILVTFTMYVRQLCTSSVAHYYQYVYVIWIAKFGVTSFRLENKIINFVAIRIFKGYAV